MEMIAVIESGATKSDWRIVSRDGSPVAGHLGRGMNVSTMKMETVYAVMEEAAGSFQELRNEILRVHLYVAGVVTEDIREKLTGILSELFPSASIEIQNDLTAAARAICGHEPGIAAILGTGSNSCQFDGEQIVRRVYSCGFILGDEGSAATLGKNFLADFLKGLVPKHISEDFASRYDSSYEAVVENVYRSAGSPSAYLGSIAPFIMEYYGDPYIKELVDGNFRNFFRRSIKQYEYMKYPVGIAGGFGNALKGIILRIADEEGVAISRFIENPIEELIRYHTI